jgi:hypothetical protein
VGLFDSAAAGAELRLIAFSPDSRAADGSGRFVTCDTVARAPSISDGLIRQGLMCALGS